MEGTLAKLLIKYNQSFKYTLNLNEKTTNKTVLEMQGKNQLLNIIEQQTTSAMVRLIQSNHIFHNGKKGAEEHQA